ncbi:MAG TPA: hypothetical protein ENN19_08910, partial [Chloroflexi bacterium]|nr:hypothetical protein [Chloroflexota bacterium]
MDSTNSRRKRRKMQHKFINQAVRLMILITLILGVFPILPTMAQLTGHTVNFSMSDLSFARIEGGDQVTYDLIEASFGGNVCELEGKVGEPALPVCNVQILLPAGTDALMLETNVKGEIVLDDAYKIIPNQPAYPLSQEPPDFAPPDPVVYASSEPIQNPVAKLVDTIVIRGYHVALVRVYPLVYVPATGQVSLRTDITLSLSKDRAARTLSYSNPDPIFEQFVASSVLNPQDIPAQYEQAALGSPSDPNDVKYLLITDASLLSAFQPLLEWKTKKGVPAEAVTVDWIYSNYPGSTNQRKIKECIKDYAQNKGTVWVVLAGDSNIVPDYDCYVQFNNYTDSTNPTDLYYAGLDDMEWNDNGNSRACETSDSIDMGPDVFVGRLSVRTLAQATAIVNKTLAYEKDFPSSGFARKLLLTGVKLWNTGDAEAKSELMYNNYINPYWNGTRYRFYDTATDFGGSSYNVTIANLNQQISNGYNHFHMATHGNTSIWGMESGSSYSSSHAQSVNNPGKYTNIVTIACITNAFDREVALSEGFIRNGNGGAVTYIGGSRYGWGIQTMNSHGASFMYNRQYYKYLFNGEPAGYTQQVGAAFAKAKEYWAGSSGTYDTMRWVQFSLNLLGDPELPLYTQDPSTFNPSYAGTISTGSQTYAVETGVANALVCLSKGNDVYTYGRADGTGRFEATISPASDGTMDVTVTAPNYDPHEGTVSVSGGQVLPPPSDLQATATPPDQIDLTWQDNSTGEDGFQIQRQIDGGSWANLATVGTGVTSYSNTGLSPATYCYRVRAYKGSDSS